MKLGLRQGGRKIAGAISMLCLWLLTASAVTASPILPVSEDFHYQSVSDYIEYLEDPSQQLTLQNILDTAHQEQFVSSPYPFLQLGFKTSAWWVRFSVHNPDSEAKNLVLSISEPSLHNVRLYAPVVDADTGLSNYQMHEAGTGTPNVQADFPAQGYWFKLNIPPEKTTTYYIRIETAFGVTTTFYLGLARDTALSAASMNLWLGLSIGLVAWLGLYYLLLLHRYQRNRTVLFYGLTMLTMALYLLSLRGVIGIEYFNFPSFQPFSQLVLLFLAQITSILFVGSFLKPGLPAIAFKATRIGAAALAVLALICTLLPTPYAALITYTSATTDSIAAIALSCFAAYRGYRPAVLLIISRSLVVFSALAATLSSLGVIGVRVEAIWVILFSYGIEAMLLAIGVSEQLNQQNINAMREHEHSLITETETRARHDFLSHMSHEIRTPMSGILGMTELLMDTPLTPNQREYASTIQVSGNALLSILNDILDHSRMEAGKLSLGQESFNLPDLIYESVSLFQSMANEKQLELIVTIDSTLPQRVIGDPARLRQVMSNLLRNAIKYTQNGEIEVSLKPSQLGLHIEIRDTGIGILPEQIAQIFQAYQQGSNNIRPQTGTGLGLSISKQLVELMGGKIGVRSKIKEGSLFWIDVPLKAESQQEEPKLIDESLLRGIRLLVVDDNRTINRVIQEQASHWGVLVRTADNGNEALALARNAANIGEPFDVILLDQNMPGLNGVQLAARIKEDPIIRNDVIVIMLTGASNAPVDLLSRNVGIRRTLMKPVTEHQLKAAIAEELGHLHQQKVKKPTAAPSLLSETLLFENLRVLIAEDNHLSQKVIQGMLNKLGINAMIVSNGREVVEEVSRREYDIVLMDCDMPFMDGYAATQAIREWEKITNRTPVPILALTAHILEEHQERSAKAGMNEHLFKPIELFELKEAILRWTQHPLETTDA